MLIIIEYFFIICHFHFLYYPIFLEVNIGTGALVINHCSLYHVNDLRQKAPFAEYLLYQAVLISAMSRHALYSLNFQGDDDANSKE